MIGTMIPYIPARSPEEDLAALFSPEQRRRAAEILCRALATGLDRNDPPAG